MTDVWAVIHHVNRGGAGDVAVASNHSDSPQEWERAHHAALRNMHHCQREALRWGEIVEELQQGWQQARQREETAHATAHDTPEKPS